MTLAASPLDDRRLLVSIRPQGLRPPLALVHSLAGELTWLPELAKLIDPERPVLGFAAPGLNAKGPPFPTLEAMAGAYVSALRTARPRGPYCLGGYSFGGVVAYEMACQLLAAGEQVESLVLIDAYGPGSTVIPSLTHWNREGILLLTVANLLGLEWEATALMRADAMPAMDPVGQVDAAARHLLAHCTIPHSYDALAAMLTSCRQVMECHTTMLAGYRLRPPPGTPPDTLLIHATHGFVPAGNALGLPAVEPQQHPGAKDHGWVAYLSTRDIAIDTEHFLMMRPPALGAVCAALDSHLRSI